MSAHPIRKLSWPASIIFPFARSPGSQEDNGPSPQLCLLCARFGRHSRRTSSTETDLLCVKQRVEDGLFVVPDCRLLRALRYAVACSLSPAPYSAVTLASWIEGGAPVPRARMTEAEIGNGSSGLVTMSRGRKRARKT